VGNKYVNKKANLILWKLRDHCNWFYAILKEAKISRDEWIELIRSLIVF